MESKLGYTDYIVLTLVFLISISIGVYHWLIPKTKKMKEPQSIPIEEMENFVDKNKTSMHQGTKMDEYFQASSSMGTIPVAFSLLASFFSSSTLLGLPVEIYQYGLLTWISAFGQLIPPLLGAYITGPFFAKLEIRSLFEYLEMRFSSKIVRKLGAFCYVVRNFMSCAIFMYGAATAFSHLSNVNETIAVLVIGCVATFYTACGGLRGVIWNDFFQAIIMILSLLLIIAKGIYDVKGVENMMKINWNGGRINLFEMNPDPFIRQSFWSVLLGPIVYMSVFYCFDQQMFQRFKATKTVKEAQRALLLNIPGMNK